MADFSNRTQVFLWCLQFIIDCYQKRNILISLVAIRGILLNIYIINFLNDDGRKFYLFLKKNNKFAADKHGLQIPPLTDFDYFWPIIGKSI